VNDLLCKEMKESGLARHDAIGVLVLNEKGEVKAEKVGTRSLGKGGAGIGLALALVTPVGLGVGIIAGGGFGALHHKGLGLDKADRERLGAELSAGKAAVGVLAPVSEAEAVKANWPNLAEPQNRTPSPMKISRKPTLPPVPARPSHGRSRMRSICCWFS